MSSFLLNYNHNGRHLNIECCHYLFYSCLGVIIVTSSIFLLYLFIKLVVYLCCIHRYHNRNIFHVPGVCSGSVLLVLASRVLRGGRRSGGVVGTMGARRVRLPTTTSMHFKGRTGLLKEYHRECFYYQGTAFF